MEIRRINRLPYSRGKILSLVMLVIAVSAISTGFFAWTLYRASGEPIAGSGLSGASVSLTGIATAGLLGAAAILLTALALYRAASKTIAAAEKDIAALVESEFSMRSYFNNCPWPMTITGLEGRYLFVSKAFEKSLGFTNEEIVGKTVRARRSSSFSDSVLSHQQRVLESGTTISEVRPMDPGIANLDERISTKFPIFNTGGSIIGIGTYITEVSSIRRAEEALRASENRLAAIFDNMPYRFSLKDREGRYEMVNQPLADWYGVPAEELIGKQIIEFSNLPQIAARLAAIEQRIFETGEAGTTEVSRTEADGQQVHMFVLKFPVCADDGAVNGIGTFAIDITGQKQTEEALRKSEGRLRDFAEAASDWFWETDEEHRIVSLSDRFTSATGIPIDWVLGKTRYESKIGESVDPAIWKRHRAELDAHRQFQNFVYHSIKSDGATVWYSISGIPVFDEKGVFTGYRGTGTNITARKTAESELHENQQLTQALLDHIPSMIGLRAPDGRYLLVNRCFERWTTISKEDVNTEAARKIWSDPHIRELDEPGPNRPGESGARVFETALEFPDGIRRDIRAVQFPVRTAEGTLLGTGFVNMDISDMRRSQEKLREKQIQLRAIIDNAPGIITLTDLENRFLMVNRSFSEAYGLEMDSVIGKPIQQVLSPGQWRSGQAHQQEVIAKGAAVVKDRVDIFPSGNPNNRLSIKFPVMDSDGEIVAIGTISIDDSDRRHAEEALKKSERLLRSIFDHSPSAITMKGLDGRYQLVSQKTQDWYGVPTSGVSTSTVNELCTDTIATWAATRDAQVLAGNETIVEETEHVFQDGQAHRVVVAKFPVPGPDGKPVGIGSIISDVTAQRESEEQLRQAQKMEVVGQLTGGVAHDFNNLLGVIIGNLDYLKSLLDSDQQSKKLVENAMKAAQNGADLNRRLLAFSRKQPLAPTILELNDHVAGMFDILQRSLGESIEIRIQYCETLWPCVADPAQVESALLNLAINARDAMPGGGVLTIETQNIEIGAGSDGPMPNLGPGEYVVLSVSDTGTGMSEEVLLHAFEPFFTTKDVGKGSGLGLSMVFGFAQQSGGDISVRSTPGQGTTFALYLPRPRRLDDAMAAPADNGPEQALG